MILRRVIDHVRQQEWTAIWIDLVIVVVGVFIGIQVANWNEAQVERKRTAMVLDGFRTDMRDYSAVARKFGRRAGNGLAAFEAARARGEQPVPYFMRFRGSDTAPKSVWEVAQQSGLGDLVHPDLMFEIGYYYSELDGIGVKFVRYSEFVESQILPRVSDPKQFYDASGNLKPEFQKNMDRLREWVADSQVTVLSADCLLKRFEAPKRPGPSCRMDYGDFVGRENEP
ncbi:MAG: hypothetical protein H7147_08290 [Frankiaceae bacterium]|nr:hypothetical protein [Arenimonas sp.]